MGTTVPLPFIGHLKTTYPVSTTQLAAVFW